MAFHIGKRQEQLIHMINKLVNLIFSWDRLRKAIFEEVDMYNSITRIMADPVASSTSAAFWCESDGWRGWTIKDNRYYFHDIPEPGISDIMYIMDGGEDEKVSI